MSKIVRAHAHILVKIKTGILCANCDLYVPCPDGVADVSKAVMKKW